MKRKAHERFHGRRGGGFAGDQSAPTGTIVAVTCACEMVRCWWVVLADVGKRCWTCGEVLQRCVVEKAAS